MGCGDLMTCELEIENFSGPLDLLYQLIKEQEIEINQISLARVADQYLEYLRQLDEFDLDGASQFTRIGAELMEIKVQTLLPGGDSSEKDEEENPLLVRLREHQLIKELSEELKCCRERSGREYFSRHFGEERESNTVLKMDRNAEDLLTLVQQAAEAWSARQRREQRREKIVNMARESISIREKTEKILTALDERDEEFFYFSDFIARAEDRIEVAATLISLLELSRQGAVILQQKKRFGKIIIYPPGGEKDEGK